MALSESRRKKLEMLTRSLAAKDMQQAGKVLRGLSGGRDRAGDGGDGPVSLEAAARGVETASGHGRYWLIRRTLADISPDDLTAQREHAAILRGARHRFDELEASPALCHIADGRPEGPLFMDIESCGLAGTPIFLVGMMAYRDGQLVFDQLLARHYGEEPAIIAAFIARLAEAETLVTFNGKAFDMTNIRERAAFHGVQLCEEPPHCDILHESRRRWRGVVPNCRLQTLEQHLCGRRRVGDIPGAHIPDAYHHFVAHADATRIKAIVHHNLLDLLTMGQLLCLLLTGEQPRVDQ